MPFRVCFEAVTSNSTRAHARGVRQPPQTGMKCLKNSQKLAIPWGRRSRTRARARATVPFSIPPPRIAGNGSGLCPRRVFRGSTRKRFREGRPAGCRGCSAPDLLRLPVSRAGRICRGCSAPDLLRLPVSRASRRCRIGCRCPGRDRGRRSFVFFSCLFDSIPIQSGGWAVGSAAGIQGFYINFFLFSSLAFSRYTATRGRCPGRDRGGGAAGSAAGVQGGAARSYIPRNAGRAAGVQSGAAACNRAKSFSNADASSGKNFLPP